MLLLFFPNSPEGFAKASSAMNLALDYLYVWGPYLGFAFLADKDIREFPCMGFSEFYHFLS